MPLPSRSRSNQTGAPSPGAPVFRSHSRNRRITLVLLHQGLELLHGKGRDLADVSTLLHHPVEEHQSVHILIRVEPLSTF